MRLNFLTLYLILFSSLSFGQPTTWNSTTTYSTGDLVVSGNATYKALQVSTNQQPPNTTYWEDLATTASNLNAPSEGAPTNLSMETILSTKPNSAPNTSTSLSSTRIVRMSVRGHIGTADDERFMRLAVSGDVNVMVRAIGPSLGQIDPSLSSISLLDPTMLISESNGTQLTSNNNDNYTTRAEKSQIESLSKSLAVVIPINQVESASIADYTTGTYYINVRDNSYSASYGTRVGWVGADITDTSSLGGFTGTSTRGVVKPGDGSMFASFEIVGDSNSTRKMFLRSRGASLSNFGVKNVLSNINLKLFKLGGVSPTLIDENTDYILQSNKAEIATAAKSFYGDLHDTDAALITDLGPGYYSIWAESESGATGVGWVGIDDITP